MPASDSTRPGRGAETQQTVATPAAADYARTGPEQDYAGHYLHATPSPVPGIAGLLIAFTLVAFGISEVRTGASKMTSLQVAAPGAAVTKGAAVLQIGAETWTLNSQLVTETDLVFRLSGAANRSPVIIVEHSAGLSASRLSRALELVNQAGFTQVGLRTSDPAPNPARSAHIPPPAQ